MRTTLRSLSLFGITSLFAPLLTALPAIAGDREAGGICRWITNPSTVDCSNDSTPPEITVYAADKTGSFYSDDFTIRGTIKSPCLASASVFESEREVSAIKIDQKRGRTRQDFEVTIDASQEPEIRAVNRSGRARVYKIDVLDIRG